MKKFKILVCLIVVIIVLFSLSAAAFCSSSYVPYHKLETYKMELPFFPWWRHHQTTTYSGTIYYDGSKGFYYTTFGPIVVQDWWNGLTHYRMFSTSYTYYEYGTDRRLTVY